MRSWAYYVISNSILLITAINLGPGTKSGSFPFVPSLAVRQKLVCFDAIDASQRYGPEMSLQGRWLLQLVLRHANPPYALLMCMLLPMLRRGGSHCKGCEYLIFSSLLLCFLIIIIKVRGDLCAVYYLDLRGVMIETDHMDQDCSVHRIISLHEVLTVQDRA
jgi:hypothetical protein